MCGGQNRQGGETREGMKHRAVRKSCTPYDRDVERNEKTQGRRGGMGRQEQNRNLSRMISPKCTGGIKPAEACGRKRTQGRAGEECAEKRESTMPRFGDAIFLNGPQGRGSGRSTAEGRTKAAGQRPIPLNRSDLLTGKIGGGGTAGQKNPPRRGVGGAKMKKWLSADSPAPAGSGRLRRKSSRDRQRPRAGNTPRRRGRSRCRGW